MEILIKALQLILSLSLLIILHELGHFLPARWFKTRVDKFYLFFDPWFSLFKKKRGDTEYGIGWLPLGGYVKIAGMIDESLDKEQLKQPPQPWEFRSKPAWQRLIIMIGGVTVNILVGIVIYSMIMFFYGEEYLSTKSLKYGISCDSLALSAGFRDGDKIVSIDGEEIRNFSKILPHIIINQSKRIELDRNGETVFVSVSPEIMKSLMNKESDFILPRMPFVVAEVPPGTPAQKAGLLKGDSLLSVNGIREAYFDVFRKQTRLHAGKPLDVIVMRGGKEITMTIQVGEDGKVGVYNHTPDHFLQLDKKEYGFFASFPAGATKAYHTMRDYIKQFNLFFDSRIKGYESLGGFITFGKVFAPTWDWFRFWNLTAFFSIALAFMNLLPIPALDGGHVMFLLYEIIFRRKPGEKFMEYAQTVGMVLLLGLMLYANFNDIIKLFR